MSDRPTPWGRPAEPAEDATTVYRKFRQHGVPADLALRAARSMYPIPVPVRADPHPPEPARVVDKRVLSKPAPVPRSTEDDEWWCRFWLIVLVGVTAVVGWVLYGALIVAGLTVYAAALIAWLIARAIWMILLTSLAGAAGGLIAALVRR